MDRHSRDPEDSYSHQPRSSANNTIPNTGGFRNWDLIDSPHHRPASSQETQPPSYINHLSHRPATFTRNHTSYPSLPSQGALDSEWSERQAQSQGTPLLRIDPARDSSSPSQPPATSNMSTVAVAFDPRMEMGIPRSSYTWPGLDSGHDLLGHDLNSIGHGSDASLTPPSGSRSITSSPPRFTLTPEQRELKRQRDQARRDSKTSVRARRAMSNYSSASQSPPMSMHEFSSASPVPVYTTAPSQISLLAEPATTLASSYMPSYSTSPLPDHGSPMFTPQFSSLPPSDYLGLNYSPGYPPPPSAHGLSSHYSRPSPPMPEPGMMYPVQAPQVLSSGGSTGPEAGHVRVVQSRPKPQCWEHGCNGRQFSTFSNLLRHQREKSGQAAKATCPNCGAEFTRTTARNGHLLHDKCKQRRNS
ncbi:hypothetical protein F4821DRAFT_258462 [Hypoxylon rubiginosum]|uniref:Uncharacterized protein n=1 Tax=Hypoxylon rubiginosum TaxID=110542 RepID=A0ACC0D5M0_9PEZI|nr:hypothetical protein F4821DRAFT_258462 [Hypoxylon rubiginosum]